jgi:hypothetical protein
LARQSSKGPSEPAERTPSTLPAIGILDVDLARVVDAWPTLPPAIRAGILALVGARYGEDRSDWLVWVDDDRVRCFSCGTVHQPGRGAPQP